MEELATTQARDTAASEASAPAPAEPSHASGPTSAAPSVSQLVVQAKLAVGPADDPYEREADAVADRVVRAIGTPPATRTESTEEELDSRVRRSPEVQRMPSDVGADVSPDRVQRAEVIGPDGGQTDAETGREIESARGGGRVMRASEQAPMESAFGADFSKIRIHEGPASADLNERIQAKAFTVGNDIFFRDGAPDTTSTAGQHLLAHELTHTLQQGGEARRSEADPIGDFHSHPTSEQHDIQRVMDVKAFKTSTSQRGLRNKVKRVDQALAAYLACGADDAVARRGALQTVIDECDGYLGFSDDDAKRKPGVQDLKDQAVREMALYAAYATGVAEADPVLKVGHLNVALEAHRRAKAVQPVDPVNILSIVGATVSGLDADQKRAVVAPDVQSLRALAADASVPQITRNILAEIIANLDEVKIAAGKPGAKQKRAWEGTDQGFEDGEEFSIDHAMDQSGGEAERLGSLAHELTHVSVGKSYENTSFFLMISTAASSAEITAKATQRSGRITELKALLGADAALTAEQKTLLTSKVKYADENKLSLYAARYGDAARGAGRRADAADKDGDAEAKDRNETKRDFFADEAAQARTIVDALATDGLPSSLLVEYDTVINQMLVYMHMWDIAMDNPVYVKLREIGTEVYNERAAARG